MSVKKANECWRIAKLEMLLLHSDGFKSLNSGNLGRYSDEKLPESPYIKYREALL